MGRCIMQLVLDRRGGRMNHIAVIMIRIRRIIRKEEALTIKERDEFERKMLDEESYWGIGRNYGRFQKCKEKRENHLEELRQLECDLERARVTEKKILYPWYCPNCNMRVLLESSASRRNTGSGDIIDCPVCQRTLYRAARHIEIDVVRGSERSVLH